MTDKLTMHENPNSLSANVQIDDELEVITCYGVRITADLLRSLATPTPKDTWMRVETVGDGAATMRNMRIPFRYGTHTYAGLEVSKACYDEIHAKLRAADYTHAFCENGAIDMHGIGLFREGEAP